MKYGFLKAKTAKACNIPVCLRGIDISKPANSIDDGYLAYAENIWSENGRLGTRPGIYCDTSNSVDIPISGSEGEYSYRLTQTEVYFGNERYRIATAETHYDISNLFVFIYLIGADRSIRSAGYMQFARVDESTFYTPESITFYTGRPQNGGGIFALVTLGNSAGSSPTEYRIYEINANLNGWEIASGYYIPTVYINGRGNAYAAAKAANSAFLGTPTELEASNRLTGTFYAYYSSDGFSDSFRLPFSSLSDQTVICRIHQSLDNYTEWIIYSGETSAKNTFFGEEVTAHVDREKGNIYFTAAAGNYPVPKMSIYSENNIRIMATKEISGSFESVVSSACAVRAGTQNIFGSENKLYYNTYENPLYFPFVSGGEVGSADSEITALKAVGDKLYILKENEAYIATLKKGDAINQTALLADNSSIFEKPCELEVKCINNRIGCKNKLTVSADNGQIVWLGSDRNIYTATESGNIYMLSQAVTPYLKELTEEKCENASGICTGKHYILLLSDKAVIMEYNSSGLKGENKENAFYLWSFPEKLRLAGAFLNQGRLSLLCENKSENTCFTACLNGDSDNIIENDAVEAYPVSATLKTKDFAFGSKGIKKKISRVDLSVTAKGSMILSLDGGKSFTEHYLQNAELAADYEHNLKLAANLPSVDKINITVGSKQNFSLGDICIHYTEMG